MNPILIALIVLVCVLAAGALGLYVHRLLPEAHLQEQSKDVIKLGIGLVATLAALVLGLLISSAKSSFDRVNDDLIQTGTKLVLLDSVLRHYGEQGKDARHRLKSAYANVVAVLFADQREGAGALDAPLAIAQAEGIRTALLALNPGDDQQRWLKTRALDIFSDLATERWLLMLQKESPISAVFLVVLVFWLAMIFMAFGLLAPSNSTVVVTLFVCALSVAGAIFLLLEMEQPLSGLMKVSSAPLREALDHLGR